MWRVFTIGCLITVIGLGVSSVAAQHQPCPHPRLWTGHLAQVSEDGTYNNVRARPDLQSQIVGQLPPGTTVAVLHGPRCRDSFNWWYVRSGDLVGWTADGDQDERWIINLYRRIPDPHPAPTSETPPLWTPQSDAEIPPLLPPGGPTATPTPVLATRIPSTPHPVGPTPDTIKVGPEWGN